MELNEAHFKLNIGMYSDMILRLSETVRTRDSSPGYQLKLSHSLVRQTDTSRPLILTPKWAFSLQHPISQYWEKTTRPHKLAE